MSTDKPHCPREFAASPTGDNAGESLSSALKRATREKHRRAETTGFIRRIIHGQATRDSYASYLRNLHPIYLALEEKLGRLRSSTGFEALTEPGLARRAALETDLAALTGKRWTTRLAMLPAAEAWARQISAASTSQLVAHAYVRYLGDLNGGRIIKRLLRESPGLVDAELGFYEFPALGDLAEFRGRFKASLDGLGSIVDNASVVGEALRAFDLATDLSIEIEESLFGGRRGERRSA